MTMSNNPGKLVEASTPAAGYDLTSLLMAAFRFVSIVVAVVALGLAALIMLLRAGMPTETTYKSAIQFVFPTVESGKYPNGLPFSKSDILSPSIIRDVYTKNEIERFNIKFNEFVAALSVSPYATSLQDSVDRYRRKLSNRRLTFAESRDIEQEMEEELRRLSQTSALIVFRLNSRFSLPVELGKKVVNDLASTWSTDSIERRGVLRLPDANGSAPLIDSQLARSLGPLALIDLYNRSVDRIEEGIERLSKVGGMDTISDEKTGHNLRSLKRELDNLETYKIGHLIGVIFSPGIIKQPDESSLFLGQHIAMLKSNKSAVEAEIENINKSLAAYTWQGGEVKSGQTSQSANSALTKGVSSTELSADLVDKIVILSKSADSESFRRELTEKQIALKQRAVSLQIDIEQLSSMQSKLSKLGDPSAAGSVQTYSVRGSEVEDLRIRVDKQFSEVTESLNAYWQVLARLNREFGKQKYSYHSQLYTDLAVPSPVTRTHPIWRWQTFVIYFSVLFATAILALLAHIFWQSRKASK